MAKIYQISYIDAYINSWSRFSGAEATETMSSYGHLTKHEALPALVYQKSLVYQPPDQLETRDTASAGDDALMVNPEDEWLISPVLASKLSVLKSFPLGVSQESYIDAFFTVNYAFEASVSQDNFGYARLYEDSDPFIAVVLEENYCFGDLSIGSELYTEALQINYATAELKVASDFYSETYDISYCSSDLQVDVNLEGSVGQINYSKSWILFPGQFRAVLEQYNYNNSHIDTVTAFSSAVRQESNVEAWILLEGQFRSEVQQVNYSSSELSEAKLISSETNQINYVESDLIVTEYINSGVNQLNSVESLLSKVHFLGAVVTQENHEASWLSSSVHFSCEVSQNFSSFSKIFVLKNLKTFPTQKNRATAKFFALEETTCQDIIVYSGYNDLQITVYNCK